MTIRAALFYRALPALLLSTGGATAQPAIEEGSPFVIGEAYPETLATCETIGDWIDRAPDYRGRISLGIEGELTAVEWDGALAYLVMCEEEDVQVLCVTYSRDGRDVGDRVVFGGGYARVGERQVMLDPCLAGPPA